MPRAPLPPTAGSHPPGWLRLSLVLVLATAGCQLRGVDLAAPGDVVMAEVVLQAGDTLQRAWLHHTLGNGGLAVPGATVQVSGPGPATVAFVPAAARVCVDSTAEVAPARAGSCYVAKIPASTIRPGGTYSLRITLPGGGTLTGTTEVPGAFRLTRPAGVAACALRAQTLLPLVWTQSSGAWLYVSETQIYDVRRALDSSAPGGGMDLIGLSLSAADTSITFPSDFGVFNRASSTDGATLVALQKGLPAGVTATIGVAAADRNYVEWVRRQSFNPSGTVQIPSIQGPGTGVFGSVVSHHFQVSSVEGSTLPPCIP